MNSETNGFLQKVTGGAQGPLLRASQLPNRFVTRAPSEAQKLLLQENPFSTFFTGKPTGNLGIYSNQKTEDRYLAHWRTLRDRLLEFGGHHVIHPGLEEDLRPLLHRGQCWTGVATKGQPQWKGIAPATLRRGAPNQCHANSCAYWEKKRDEDVFLATGYALHKDGAWYQHSWCIEVVYVGEVRVVESTIKAIAYYGFVLSEDESNEFAFENLW